MDQQQDQPADTVIRLTDMEANRFREIIGQREGARVVAQAAVNLANQIAAQADSEIESLKAHYGLSPVVKVALNLTSGTITVVE